MKKILMATSLAFLLMLPSVCLAEWAKVGRDNKGRDIYVDYDTLKKGGGNYLVYWELIDQVERSEERLSGGDYTIFTKMGSEKNWNRVYCKGFFFNKTPAWKRMYYVKCEGLMGENCGSGISWVSRLKPIPPDAWNAPLFKKICEIGKKFDEK